MLLIDKLEEVLMLMKNVYVVGTGMYIMACITCVYVLVLKW